MTTSTRKRAIPRQRHPELERDISRSPSLGYEAPQTGQVRWPVCSSYFEGKDG